MTTAIDGLTSPTLKHLREDWWDEEFTEFLAETLRPRPGNRILDVGCGEGLAEVSIGRLHISQIRLVGVDLAVSKVIAAARETASHNQRVRFAAADACHLPFATGAFDSLFCVAVLPHVADVNLALAECARVTARTGRSPDGRSVNELRSEKTDRAALASMLSELAMRLNDEFKFSADE